MKTNTLKRTPKHYLRELDSVQFLPLPVPKKFKEFCRSDVLPNINVKGYKQKQKYEAIMKATRAIVEAALNDRVVADSRDMRKAGVRARVEAWNALETAGFCKVSIGSESSKRVTRYAATKKLMNLKSIWESKLFTEDSSSDLLDLVVLTKKESKFQMKARGATNPKKFRAKLTDITWMQAQPGVDGRPDPMAIKNGVEHYREHAATINAINGFNSDHSWKTSNNAGVFYNPSVQIREQHAGEPYRAVRYYTHGANAGQSVPKSHRARMLIDGEAAVELDFSGSIPRLAKHLCKVPFPPNQDVYSMDQILPRFCKTQRPHTRKWKLLREFIKKATLICFNTGSKAKAQQSVFGYLRDQPETPVINRVLSKEGLTIKNLIYERIPSVHSDVSKLLFCDEGVTLMTVESRIMFTILIELVLKRKKPALPIHDAILVRISDARLAKRIMEEVYSWFCGGFRPLVKAK